MKWNFADLNFNILTVGCLLLVLKVFGLGWTAFVLFSGNFAIYAE
jgi:hypothetical protein